MRKTQLLAIGLLSAVLSCSRGQESEAPGEPGAAQQEKVAIQLGLNMKSLVDTKSQGTVDAWNGNQELHIFAFPFTENGTLDWAHPYINDVAAASPASGTSGRINLYNPEGGPTEPFFYDWNSVYDFFGYYIDDALQSGSSIEMDAGNDYVAWLTLNGQQDILFGTTDRALAAADGGIGLERVYSAYAARRGVHPELVFQHALSRFQFRVVSGSATVAEHVTLDALALEGDIDAGFVVAGPDAGYFVSAYPGWLDLPLSSEVAMPAADGTLQALPGCIMTAPGYSSHKLKLHFNQEGVTDSAANTLEVEVKLEDLVGATEPVTVAGHSYWVNIVIYGLEDVRVTVTLANWDEVGTVEIDPDADIFLSAPGVVPVEAAGGEVSFDIKYAPGTEYVYTLDADWVSNGAEGTPTEANGRVTETLTFVVEANEALSRRVCNVRFWVNGKPDATVQLSQDGADFPDALGIYRQASEDYIFNPAQEQVNVYAQGNVRYSRFLIPMNLEADEVGPIPASLSLGQEFDATFTRSIDGQVAEQFTENLHLRVTALSGRKVKLLDTNTMNGYTLMY